MILVKYRNVLSKFIKLYIRQQHSNIDLPFAVSNLGGNITLIPRRSNHENTLIWIHSENESCRQYVPWFNCEDSIVPFSTRVILPCAPERISSGNIINSWYKIRRYTRTVEQCEGLLWSYNYIMNIITEELILLNKQYDRIFLGGFSQGCSLALWILLNCKIKFGGFCGFSGQLFPFADINEQVSKDIPILLYHGEEDDVVFVNKAVNTYERLKERDLNVKLLIEKELGHWISERGKSHLRYFLHRALT